MLKGRGDGGPLPKIYTKRGDYMMGKITLDALAIELTRRCNMACGHCLRGDAQSIDLDRRHIDALLDQTQMVGKLVLTGGEPTLAAETIEYVAEGMIDRQIPLLGLEMNINQ